MWNFNLIRFMLWMAGIKVNWSCWTFMDGWGNEDPNSPPPCFYE